MTRLNNTILTNINAPSTITKRCKLSQNDNNLDHMDHSTNNIFWSITSKSVNGLTKKKRKKKNEQNVVHLEIQQIYAVFFPLRPIGRSIP